jgi:pimeloyl-ACP methyl ester carboxylesterase
VLVRALLARRPLLLLGEPGQPDPACLRELLLGARASEALVARFVAALRDESFLACLDWLRPQPVPRDAGVPALAISGRDDPLVTPAALRRTAVAWDAVAHVVPHAGHCPMLGDGAGIVARHVERWLFDA